MLRACLHTEFSRVFTPQVWKAYKIRNHPDFSCIFNSEQSAQTGGPKAITYKKIPVIISGGECEIDFAKIRQKVLRYLA